MLVKHNIGVLGMKPMGDGLILNSKTATPIECLHYAMNLPTSVVITGCDSLQILQQAIDAAQQFPADGFERGRQPAGENRAGRRQRRIRALQNLPRLRRNIS